MSDQRAKALADATSKTMDEKIAPLTKLVLQISENVRLQGDLLKKKNAPGGLTPELGKALGDGLYDVVNKYLEKKTAPLLQRIASLEAQMQLVHSKSLQFRGVWQPAQDYIKGDLATYQGSLWHCNGSGTGYGETKAQPGTGPSWTLAVKNGAMGGR